MVTIKRAYEPASRKDGRRVLVERLWPRGVKKTELALDQWLKDVAPSPALRKWYAHEVERWPEFVRRYREELKRPPAAEALAALRAQAADGPLTLVYGARDEEHNSARVLRDLLDRAPARPRRAARSRK